MLDDDGLTARFARERPRLLALARRMLRSETDAEDAVQETWLRLGRGGADGVTNLPAWLTTVCARVCLNMMRARRSRPETPLDDLTQADPADPAAPDPAQEAELADAVGQALLVVLDSLSPAERVAFVLHDVFELPFDQIAATLDRTPDSTRQLASRARRRVRDSTAPRRDPGRRRDVVQAYLDATRQGDFAALVAILHPDVVLRADAAALPGRTLEPVVLRGVDAVATGALASAVRARNTELVLVDGAPGLEMSPAGPVRVVLVFGMVDDLITEIDVVADPVRLVALDVRVG